MRHSTHHDEFRTRRWFFIGVEVGLVLAWCGLFIERRLSGALSDVCIWALLISIVLLLFVLPWFWSTLRHVALIGWVMAAASVLYLLLYAPAHR
jgi:hypothetical protein